MDQEEKIYSIKLTDGTVIENLRLNGNVFISAEEISADAFEDNCDPVTFSDGDTTEVHQHMALVAIERHGNKYWIMLRDRTSDELDKLKIMADIEYLAMMTDVDM